MVKSLSILFLENREEDVRLVTAELESAGYLVRFRLSESEADFAVALKEGGWDAVFCDGALPDFPVGEALRRFREFGVDIPFMIIADRDCETEALKAMNHGAADFFVAGELARLVPALEREVRDSRERRKRSKAETALRESEERYRLLAECTRDLVGLHSVEGNLLYISPSVRELLGFEPGELIGTDFFERVHPEDRVRVREEFARVASEGETVPSIECRLLRRDDVGIWFETLVQPVIDESGNVSKLQSSSREVAERREVEQRFRQVQKMESLGNLAGGIAHDFNNILAVINGYSELILSLPEADEQVRKFAREISRSGERASQLVRQILTFARKTNTTFGTVQLNDLLGNVCDLLEETFPRSISISRSFDRSLGPIQADAQQISQVLMNLAVNSRDAMKDSGGTLSVVTERLDASKLPGEFARIADSDYACIRISDTGCGMDKEVSSRIFEPFFTTKDVGEGTGLGLAVVYGILQNHCGYVDVQSEPGTGTSITLYFPTALSENAPGGDISRSPEPPGGEETLLLVEDEVLVAEWLRWSLTQKGYRVFWAMNGLDAMKIYAHEGKNISLVLSDHGLPGMSGWELFGKLKQSNPEVLFVIATGYLDPQLKQGMLESGIADFFNKPFKRKDLLNRIRRLLDLERQRVPGGKGVESTGS